MPLPLGRSMSDLTDTGASLTCALLPAEFGHSSSNGWCIIKEIIQRSLTLRVLLFKVTQGH